MYSGTHDNDTSLGWFSTLPKTERQLVTDFLGCDTESLLDRLLRVAFMSSSKLCMIPVQDVLGLGAGNRMNTPGRTDGGNWTWRMPLEYLSEKYFTTIKGYTEIYGRVPDTAFTL